MSGFLRKWKWEHPYTYTAARDGRGEDERHLVKEESGSSSINDEDDESSTLSSFQPNRREEETRCRSGYSLASVVILFGLGVILGSFVPVGAGSRGNTQLSFVPEIPLREYTFRDTPEFSSQAPDNGNSSWASLLPPINGMIQIDDPEKYDLPPGLPLYSNRNPSNAIRKKYAMSVFHQIHCLQMLREEYMIHVGIFGGGLMTHDGDPQAAESHKGRHLEHCFDYLRQSVMCCADTTIEWANPDAGPTQKPLIDGWEIPHKECKDWSKVLEFTAEHEAPLVVDG